MLISPKWVQSGPPPASKTVHARAIILKVIGPNFGGIGLQLSGRVQRPSEKNSSIQQSISYNSNTNVYFFHLSDWGHKMGPVQKTHPDHKMFV